MTFPYDLRSCFTCQWATWHPGVSANAFGPAEEGWYECRKGVGNITERDIIHYCKIHQTWECQYYLRSWGPVKEKETNNG